ncbi:hypothetical protein [Nocardioides donggukensis]|uniref:DUF4064 domain-containing protein n=1 Tax=Nocardioides donggukensis TaxID=2774019 RepID=A0A927PYI6_9ACTN|nr:hypothetical protein [Nocardioides donggukensis]MBD8868228.1 hypothetical protein [Nocardioides donggukensis]
MSDGKLVRPPQVTMAAWVTIVGSAFLVLTVFDTVANLRSLDTRTSVEETLGSPPLDGLGLGVERALSLMHVMAVVAAACATAAAILGWQVLRRNTLARVALSVLVVPLFVAGIVTGGFLSSMVAVSVVLLWSRPARDWFNGIAPAAPPSPPPPRDPALGPPPFSGFGTLPPQEGALVAGSVPDHPYAVRPRPVVQACILTWAFSSMVLGTVLVSGLALALDSSVLQEAYASDPVLADAGLSLDDVRLTAAVFAGLFGVWAIVALVLGVLTYRRHEWARITLIVSAAVAGALSLVAAIALPVVLMLTAACALTVVQLVRPASTAWFTDRPVERNP